MNMKLALALAVAVVVAGAIPFVRAENTTSKVPVRSLDIGYRLDTGKLRARVNLVAGDVVDFDVADKDRETFFNIAKVLSGGHARLSAELEDGKVVGLDVAVP